MLNAAYSETKKSFLYVNTSENYYKERQFECNFMGLCAVDCPTFKLSKHFQKASDFIDLAVNVKGNDKRPLYFLICLLSLNNLAPFFK